MDLDNIQFMLRTDGVIVKPLTLEQIEKVSDGIRLLAEAFDLNWDEVLEHQSKYMTRDEFESVMQELQQNDD